MSGKDMGNNILFVEHYRPFFKMAREVLRHEGYRVYKVSEANIGNACRTLTDQGRDFSVVTDYAFNGHGTYGTRVANEVKGLYPGVPVVCLVGCETGLDPMPQSDKNRFDAVFQRTSGVLYDEEFFSAINGKKQ